MKKKATGIILALMMTAGVMTAPAAFAEESASQNAGTNETTLQMSVDDPEADDDKVIEDAVSDQLADEDAKEKAASAAEDAYKNDKEEDADKSDEELVAPESVDGVSARAKGRGMTKIKWDPVEDADGYYVCKASSLNGKYNVCKKIKNGSKTKCVDKYKKLRKNKKYYYKVFAYKVADGETVISETAEKDSAKNTLSYSKKINMKATAYSGGGSCANGKRCKVGRVAVDPKVIPLGTWLYVKGYGFCQACDTGGAIKGKRIDLYFNSEGKCESYGVRSTQVYVLRK